LRRTLAGLGLAAALGGGAAAAPAEKTLLVSRQSDAEGGLRANGSSASASVSADGRYVAFVSSATNLSRDDRDGARDVFVRNLEQGTTTLVSRASGAGGAGANRDSFRPRISANGRYVAFESSATNMSRDDRDRVRDVFVRDLRGATTTLVSRANGRRGAPADGNSTGPSISGGGRYVAFESPAANLSREDDDKHGNVYDVLVRDLRRGRTELVSRRTGRRGAPASASAQAMVSGNGRFVAFDSGAPDLKPRGVRAVLEVFVRDLRRKRTVLVSRASGGHGAPARGTASQPSISATGRFVAFESPSPNLSRGDRRGFDLFVRDLRRKRTSLVTRASGAHGKGANAVAECFSISASGRYVAFESRATNLSGEDRHDVVDVFLRDLRRHTTTLVSRATDGVAADGDSGCPSPSGDASRVAFESFAGNLDPADRDEAEDVFARLRTGR
jgi:Tol biopolymer transport system component